METINQVQGFAYLAGGLLFGIALYRAHVLARWAAVLLAVGGVVSAALSVMPDAFYRLLAYPNGVAMIGLGYSLWSVAHRGVPTQPAEVGDRRATTTGGGSDRMTTMSVRRRRPGYHRAVGRTLMVAGALFGDGVLAHDLSIASAWSSTWPSPSGRSVVARPASATAACPGGDAVP